MMFLMVFNFNIVIKPRFLSHHELLVLNSSDEVLGGQYNKK